MHPRLDFAFVTPTLDSHTALFLDFDGTLVDLAARPEAVTVPADLVDLLGALRIRLAGALAVVSGRPLAQIDAHLAPLQLPAAGVHGTERRRADGELERLAVADLDAASLATLQALADRHAGVLLEIKPGATALHYRLAPDAEALCVAAMRTIAASRPDLSLLEGKCVLELKSAKSGKGRAIEAFLREPPFIGRRAVFAGDDVTDEAGFAAVQALGGIGIKVGEGPSVAHERLASPEAVRAWLARVH